MASWGGKRQGAGRPRSGGFVRDEVAKGFGSRTSIYRGMRRAERLTPEAMAFATNRAKLITGKALDIAGEFETAEEQITALQYAIELRKERRQLTLITTILRLRNPKA